MKVVILVGGFGTRMAENCTTCGEIGAMPILWCQYLLVETPHMP